MIFCLKGNDIGYILRQQFDKFHQNFIPDNVSLLDYFIDQNHAHFNGMDPIFNTIDWPILQKYLPFEEIISHDYSNKKY